MSRNVVPLRRNGSALSLSTVSQVSYQVVMVSMRVIKSHTLCGVALMLID
jgi:hypothetical protein